MPKLVIIILILFRLMLIMKCHEEEATEVTECDGNDTSEYYTAAVMEFHAPGSVESTDPQHIVDANLNEYIRWIYEAKEHGVDILVFSEASLNYHGIKEKEDLIKFAIELPEEMSDDNYGCDYTTNFLLNELSEAVANVSIYVLVNIVERCNGSSDVVSLFNTNIVFDRSGCIVSRYRKFNLFIEPDMSAPEEPEMSFFEADFGVTFGHFICFDILFRAPAHDMIKLNVSHILYPSMWYSEMPFLTSTQIQMHYAYRNNIVLLSAGTNSPSNANTGSGIFVGRHGAIESIISSRNESKMIVARVPKDVNDADYRPEMPAIKPYTPSEMDTLELLSQRLPASALTYPLSEGSIIHANGVECEFSIDFTRLQPEEQEDGGGGVGSSSSQYGYRLIAFNGIRSYANASNGGEIYCAIIACLNESDPMTCGRKFESSESLLPSVQFHSIKIKATLAEADESNLIMPTSLDFSIRPLSVEEFEFTIENDATTYAIEATNELNEILTFGIYGRNFDKDGKYQPIEDGGEKEEESAEMNASTLRLDDELEVMEMSEEVHRTKEKIRGHGDPNIFLTVAIYVPLMIVLCIIAAILVYRRLKDPYEHPLIVMRRKSEMLQGMA